MARPTVTPAGLGPVRIHPDHDGSAQVRFPDGRRLDDVGPGGRRWQVLIPSAGFPTMTGRGRHGPGPDGPEGAR